jgi:hypothetical protein
MTLHGLIDTSDSNIHLIFSITSSTSTPRLMLTLRCMVHHSKVLVDPSLITIMIHMFLRVFDKLTLVTLCYFDVDEYDFMS